MKNLRKQFKHLSLILVLSSTIASIGTFASAASCPEYTTIHDENITVTPALDCLNINIDGSCLEQKVGIVFFNHCEEEGTKVVGPDYESEFTNSWTEDEFDIVSGTEENRTYTAFIGEKSYEVKVSFKPVYEIDESCSTTGGRPLSFFLLVGFGFVLVRKKRK